MFYLPFAYPLVTPWQSSSPAITLEDFNIHVSDLSPPWHVSTLSLWLSVPFYLCKPILRTHPGFVFTLETSHLSTSLLSHPIKEVQGAKTFRRLLALSLSLLPTLNDTSSNTLAYLILLLSWIIYHATDRQSNLLNSLLLCLDRGQPTVRCTVPSGITSLKWVSHINCPVYYHSSSGLFQNPTPNPHFLCSINNFAFSSQK